MDYSHPAEGGEIEWEIYDRKGYRAKWLEAKMDSRAEDALYQELFDYLQEPQDE